MTLTLTIENEQSLPNGAPVSVRLTDKRGIDIGRSATIDWSLPDPTRFISGRHCEVRYRDDGYWLNDLSTNGTFLNDSTRRIQAPHKLRHGDRLAIGSYVIAVSIEAEEPPETDRPEPSGAEIAGDLALAPIEPLNMAALGAPIAEAIMIETAPTPEPPPEPLPEAMERPSGAIAPAGAVQSAPPSRDVNGGGGRERATPERPFTMVRARGFFAPIRPGAADPPAAPAAEPLFAPSTNPPRDFAPQRLVPAHSEAWDDLAPPPDRDGPAFGAAGFDARSTEALAWSAPEGAPQPPATPDFQPEVLREKTTSERQDARGVEAQAEGVPTPAPAPEKTPGVDEFLRSFAKGARIPENVFARQDALKVAEDLGALMRMAVEDLTQLLSARFRAKRFARTSSQTMIQALDNNPLKFAPTADDALKIMFGPRTSGYLDAKRAFEGAFTDLKTHQVNTFAAMQQAVRMLVEDFDPKAIEEAAGEDKGLAALFGAHKARLWDLFLARWQAKSLRHEDGLVDAFMLYFAQCYDQAKES